MKKDDEISFFDRNKGEILFISKVLSITKFTDKYLVTFDKNISKHIQYKDLHLYNRACTNKNFIIQNSTFQKSRRYGCYIKAFDGKIINNTFKNLGGSAIAIKNEPSWPEGLNSENILIKGNAISKSGFGFFKQAALIDIKFLKLKGLSDFNEHKNIKIINNTIDSKGFVSIKNIKKSIAKK